MPSPRGGKEKGKVFLSTRISTLNAFDIAEGDSYRLAAMEPDKRTSWLAHLQLKNAAKWDESRKDSGSKVRQFCLLSYTFNLTNGQTPTRAGRCFGSPKSDFLWLQRKENGWNRYFCVSSGDYLEWYILGPVVKFVLPISLFCTYYSSFASQFLEIHPLGFDHCSGER